MHPGFSPWPQKPFLAWNTYIEMLIQRSKTLWDLKFTTVEVMFYLLHSGSARFRGASISSFALCQWTVTNADTRDPVSNYLHRRVPLFSRFWSAYYHCKISCILEIDNCERNGIWVLHQEWNSDYSAFRARHSFPSESLILQTWLLIPKFRRIKGK